MSIWSCVAFLIIVCSSSLKCIYTLHKHERDALSLLPPIHALSPFQIFPTFSELFLNLNRWALLEELPYKYTLVICSFLHVQYWQYFLLLRMQDALLHFHLYPHMKPYIFIHHKLFLTCTHTNNDIFWSKGIYIKKTLKLILSHVKI